jgi:hypothetical protein
MELFDLIGIRHRMGAFLSRAQHVLFSACAPDALDELNDDLGPAVALREWPDAGVGVPHY